MQHEQRILEALAPLTRNPSSPKKKKIVQIKKLRLYCQLQIRNKVYVRYIDIYICLIPKQFYPHYICSSSYLALAHKSMDILKYEYTTKHK